MTNFNPIVQSVCTFNWDVIGVVPPEYVDPLGLDPASKEWLGKALNEEALEFMEAETSVDQVDALVDTIIFAIGGMYRMGLTLSQIDACLAAVMEANFKKKAGVKANRAVEGVKDGVKPEGWVGPEARIAEILEG